MHVSSMEAMEAFRDKYLNGMNGSSIIDIGSKNVHPNEQYDYRRIFEPRFKYFGMDIEPGHNVDIVGFNELDKIGQFDILISGQAMEHVNRPWEWLKSLTKYFSKYICIIAPHTFKEHKHPIDTYRYFPDGMRDLFDYAGIKEIEIYKNRNDTIGIGKK